MNTLLPSLKRSARQWFVSKQVTHIYGPKTIKLSSEEAAVTCVVKNGQFYVEKFIRHYLGLGFRHIFFLDNGSDDDTVALVTQFKSNVTVYRCTLPIDGYQELLKTHLAQRIVANGWCLDVDIDEFFDYPLRACLTLTEFIRYLNQKRFTAVVTQLLDMFSEKPLAALRQSNMFRLDRSVYQYYDLSDVSAGEYLSEEMTRRHGPRNQVCHHKTALYWGGIRQRLYDNRCLLTKHSLFCLGKNIRLFPHVHFVDNADLADVSCVLLHYKLTADAMATALQNRKEFLGTSPSYDAFIDFLTQRSADPIKEDTSVKLEAVDDLMETGFLFASRTYREYARSNARDGCCALALGKEE